MSRHDVSGTSVTILMADDDEEDREMTRGVGRDQLLDYIRREHEAEGVASVRMGTPVVEGDHVVGEFWTTMSKPGEIATLIGCFIAKLDEPTGRCHHFRQYWHEVDERVTPYEGWGE